ncbi:hypothetical protein GCM10007973_27950 [Polymorphobacter multimanifer]|uniref:Polymerase nucleotidyl transferase domain-containing protein n=1 Tax=Polymorphobacter multimanifer TaxID=1070431 RepID=A0A841LGS5_9SPHN|nr:nucleotidyltransferase family protein [Polymorphobacter multimanifer]MBB6228178.1 hypothetical protein [Polymorphobacter multimanifer]GGI90012.1 hypothetical protein GCM10007973_27950 [Polymorphobacter multimanifer]
MRRAETSSRLKAHADALRQAGVASLFVFGSTARDEATAASDVDIFFDPSPARFNLFDVMAVREKIEEFLGCRADVMTRKSIHPHLRDRIEAEAVQIF